MNAQRMGASAVGMIVVAASAWFVGQAGAQSPQPEVDFGPVPYEKLATRELTLRRMIDRLQNRPALEWGPWHALLPFPGDEKGTLAQPLPPEEELAKMRDGGPGPDLGRVYQGRDGMQIRWADVGKVLDRPVELRLHPDKKYHNEGTAYLYRRFESERDAEVPVTMGSDDGLRFWLNGELLVDADVPRGLNSLDHSLVLRVRKGVNHILCKVTQGGGSWEYQLNATLPLDPVTDAKLQHALSRDFPRAEDIHYPAVTIPVPEDVVLEVGGLDVLPDGRPIVCTRRGEVWIIGNLEPELPFSPRCVLFAQGLHEPLGLAVREEEINGKKRWAACCVQRGELTRLVDLDGDDRADLYDAFCDDWGVSGNYHEFAFGPKFDANGNAWVTLNVGFCGSLGKSVSPYRGWSLMVTPDRRMVPVSDGLRSPNGIGIWLDGSVFYLDNQGDYVGTNRMTLMSPGSWAGHPASLRWRVQWHSESREPARQPATIWFPYKKMGQSAADFLLDQTGGKFGPFTGHIFVGDQTLSAVMRASIQVVQAPDGSTVYQGACYPFRENLDCGVNRLAFDAQGRMYVGQTDRGWGSVGRKRHGVQRIVWSGVTPFEILEMRATPEGFEVEYTLEPGEGAASPSSYSMVSYTYEYHAAYGSDEMETRDVAITRVDRVSPKVFRLVCEGVRAGKGPDGTGEGYVHELRVKGLRAAGGQSLVHDRAYYTLQVIPRNR